METQIREARGYIREGHEESLAEVDEEPPQSKSTWSEREG
jgi:hypothetical protein